MQYQPKRASKRWTEAAPHYVLACYDNGGKTADRYTVLFGWPIWQESDGRDVPYLGMSGAPTHPQGFSQWGEMPSNNRDACGKHVRWLDLPEDIRAHVVARAREGCDETWQLRQLELTHVPSRAERLARDGGWFPTNTAHIAFKDARGVCRHLKAGETYTDNLDSLMSVPLRHAGSWRAAVTMDKLDAK